MLCKSSSAGTGVVNAHMHAGLPGTHVGLVSRAHACMHHRAKILEDNAPSLALFTSLGFAETKRVAVFHEVSPIQPHTANAALDCPMQPNAAPCSLMQPRAALMPHLYSIQW